MDFSNWLRKNNSVFFVWGFTFWHETNYTKNILIISIYTRNFENWKRTHINFTEKNMGSVKGFRAKSVFVSSLRWENIKHFTGWLLGKRSKEHRPKSNCVNLKLLCSSSKKPADDVKNAFYVLSPLWISRFSTSLCPTCIHILYDGYIWTIMDLDLTKHNKKKKKIKKTD